MRLIPLALIAIATVAAAYAFGAEPPAPTAPSPAPEPRESRPAPLHTRPYTVKCAATVNVWVEVDSSSLPAREFTSTESKKHVLLSLISSTPYRGDTVVCSYATRRRDVTSSYTVRCLQPRKERGYGHSYLCQ